MPFTRPRDLSTARRLCLMLATSAVLLLVSVALMVGTTCAWFSDSVVTEGNAIRAAETFKTPLPASASDELLAEEPDAADEEGPVADKQQPEGEPLSNPEMPELEEEPPVGDGEGAPGQGVEDLMRLEAGG